MTHEHTWLRYLKQGWGMEKIKCLILEILSFRELVNIYLEILSIWMNIFKTHDGERY